MIKSYEEMSIEMYDRLMKIVEDPDLEKHVKNLKIVAELSEIDEEELWDMPLPEFRKLIGEASFLNDQPILKGEIPDRYKIGGYDLIPVKDQKKMTAGQYIDFQTYLDQGGEVERRVELLSCLLVPKGSKYNDESYDLEDLQRVIREEMSIIWAMELASFFVKRSVRSIANTLNCLDRDMMAMKRRARKNPKMGDLMDQWKKKKKEWDLIQDSLRDGDGLLTLMQCLRLPALIGTLSEG